MHLNWTSHLFLDDHDVLSWQVFNGKHKSPVEVSVSIERAVVHVRLLSVVLSTKPTKGGWVLSGGGGV